MATTAEILSRVATRPTWAEVSLTALRQNFRTVQKHVGANVTVCAVVKADAYGHGAVECSRALEAEGAKWLGVTSLDEAIPLREAGIRANILLMTGFWRGEESEIIRLHLTPTVWEPWHIETLETAAAALGVARHPVHLKVDTGMGRLGVAVDQLPGVLAAMQAAKHLVLEGLSTHLASSEIMDAPSVAEQERSFDNGQGNMVFEELASCPVVRCSGVERCIGKLGVARQDSRDVGGRFVHFLVLRAAVSRSLSRTR